MKRAATLFAGALVMLADAPARAGPEEDARIQALEAQVKVLTERLEAVEAERQPSAPPPGATAAVPVPVPAALPSSQATTQDPTPGRAEDGTVAVVNTALDRSLQNLGNWAEISATSDAAQVSVKLGGYFSNPNLRGRSAGWASYDRWSVTASAPLGKTTRTDIGTLDALVDSSKLKFGWTQFRTKISDPRATDRGKQIVEQARTACTNGNGNACDAGIVGSEFVRTWLGQAVESEYLRLAFPATINWAYGVETSVGYRKYSFLTPLTGAKSEVERAPYSIKGFVSALPGSELISITAGIEYQRSWKERDVVAICPSLTAPETCPVGPGDAPAGQSKLLTSLEYRQQFQIGSKGAFLSTLGVSIQGTYDWENDEWGIDVPIYLVPNDKGAMIGGVRIGYTSKEEFVAGVFVSTPFSIFP